MNRRAFLASATLLSAFSSMVPAQNTKRSKFLFVANDVDEYLGLPTGSVESYSIGPQGQRTLLSRQPLSLSAASPRSLAVSGNYLIVAAYAGGIYNSLPISQEGHLGRVTHIRKEIGSGPHPVKQTSAHPHSLLVHPSGEFIFATDLGSDRINIFAARNGQLELLSRHATPPGSGPGQIELHPSGEFLHIHNELIATRTTYRFSSANATICPV